MLEYSSQQARERITRSLVHYFTVAGVKVDGDMYGEMSQLVDEIDQAVQYEAELDRLRQRE